MYIRLNHIITYSLWNIDYLYLGVRALKLLLIRLALKYNGTKIEFNYAIPVLFSINLKILYWRCKLIYLLIKAYIIKFKLRL